MTEVQFFSEMRELIGNPTQSEVPDRRLTIFANGALEKLAQVLKYSLKEDQVSLELVAGQQEYPLPADVSKIVWLEYAGLKLRSATTFLWDRDGVNWRAPSTGIPSEFAIEGRQLIFDNLPSAQTIANYKRVTYKYVSASPGIDLTGIPSLPEADARLAVQLAALRWCVANPTNENNARAQGLQALLEMDLPDAMDRHENPVEDFQPGFGVKVSRQGGAR